MSEDARPIKLVHRLEYGVMRCALFGIERLPEWVSYPLVARLAEGFLMVARKRRRIGEENLRRAIPDLEPRDVRRILNRSTANAFQNVLDLFRSMRLVRKGTFMDYVDMSSFVDQFPGQPMVGIAMHLGSWEVPLWAIGKHYGSADAIGRPPRNPLNAAFLQRAREASKVTLHNRRGGARPIARALKDGGIAMLVLDQNQRMRGIFVPFFGKLASTDRSAATLALRNGYPIYIGCVARVGGRFRFRFDMEPAFVPENTGDAEADLLATVTRINQTIEKVVLRYPDQYLWIHNRYRTRPPEEVGEAAG